MKGVAQGCSVANPCVFCVKHSVVPSMQWPRPQKLVMSPSHLTASLALGNVKKKVGVDLIQGRKGMFWRRWTSSLIKWRGEG